MNPRIESEATAMGFTKEAAALLGSFARASALTKRTRMARDAAVRKLATKTKAALSKK